MKEACSYILKIENRIKKFYSKHDCLFHIIDETGKEETFCKFDDFYNRLNGDLSGVDLLDYNFKHVKIKKYNLNNAKISSKIMKKAKVYDNYHQNIIRKIKNTKYVTLENKQSLVKKDNSSNLCVYGQPNYEDVLFLYVSDIHLESKIKNKFKHKVNVYEIEKFIVEIINDFYKSIPINFKNIKIVITGDVSAEYEYFKLFFENYVKIIPYQTFFVLGNNEIIAFDCMYEEAVSIYREFLSSLNIIMLENEIYLPNQNLIISENEFLDNKSAVLYDVIKNETYCILGGMGCAGKNETFNADMGLYSTNINREQEILISKKMQLLHEKLVGLDPCKNIIIATHMPMNDWAESEYKKNGYYISGHTHSNYSQYNNITKIFADNQICRNGTNYKFKGFVFYIGYGIFDGYQNGIYKTTKEAYQKFLFQHGVTSIIKRDYTKWFMLKKDNIYSFIVSNDKDKLMMLNGGKVKALENNDLNYYYSNMTKYMHNIRKMMISYKELQCHISNDIKRIGGIGTIHGAIVDIDYYNHLFVNPFDFKITPYYASDVLNKQVYSSVEKLLERKNQRIYKMMIECRKNQNELMIVEKNIAQIEDGKIVKETDIYKVSYAVGIFNNMLDSNVIVKWDDDILNFEKQYEIYDEKLYLIDD